MNKAYDSALERALVFAIDLSDSKGTLRRFEDANRIALFLLPEENLGRVRRAWQKRHARLTRVHQEPFPSSPAVAGRSRENDP